MTSLMASMRSAGTSFVLVFHSEASCLRGRLRPCAQEQDWGAPPEGQLSRGGFFEEVRSQSPHLPCASFTPTDLKDTIKPRTRLSSSHHCLATCYTTCLQGDSSFGRFCGALQGERRPDEAQSREQHGGECGRRCACRRREGNGSDVWFGIPRAWFQMLLRCQE